MESNHLLMVTKCYIYRLPLNITMVNWIERVKPKLQAMVAEKTSVHLNKYKSNNLIARPVKLHIKKI